MKSLKYIYGGTAARFSLARRSSVSAGSRSIFSSALKFAAVLAVVCLFSLVHAAQAATLGRSPLRNQCAAAAKAGVAGEITLPLHAIPEPQTWITAFSGLGTLLALQRFRRTRS